MTKDHKRRIEGRDFWFSIGRPQDSDPITGELTEAPGYYVTFSDMGPSDVHRDEFVRDDRGWGRIFPTAKQALAAGVREVKARLTVPAGSFGVGLPGPMKRSESDAYVRLLREEGVDPDAEPRVPDSFGRRWIHAWGDRATAERLAARLREETGNVFWEVYDLTPPAPPNGQGPLRIEVGRQTEGNTYELHPASAAILRQRFPQARARSSVFVRRRSDGEFGPPGAVYDRVVAVLTGLPVEQVGEAFGGYRVGDPISNLTLWWARPPAG